MANVGYCNNNKLLKNNYYFALSTSNVPNLIQLPATHTGIADSSANRFFFAPGAPVANHNPAAPTVGVHVVNGCRSNPQPKPPWLQCHPFPPQQCRGMSCHLSFILSLVWDHLPTKDAVLSSQRLQSPSIIQTGILSLRDGEIYKALASAISHFSPHNQQLPQSLSRQPGGSHVFPPPCQLGFSIPTSGRPQITLAQLAW